MCVKDVDEAEILVSSSAPIRVACVLSPEVQASITNVDPGVERQARLTGLGEACAKAMAEAKEKLHLRIEGEQQAREAYFSAQALTAAAHEEIEDLQRIEMRLAKGTQPIFTYVYAKHDGCDREYCWRAPFRLEDSIRTGDRIDVVTSRGVQPATVTRVERSVDFLPHAPVYRLCLGAR